MSNKFNIGDVVRITHKPSEEVLNTWPNSWVSNMDQQVGQIGRVISGTSSHCDVTVRFNDGFMWDFPLQCVEILDEDTSI